MAEKPHNQEHHAYYLLKIFEDKSPDKDCPAGIMKCLIKFRNSLLKALKGSYAQEPFYEIQSKKDLTNDPSCSFKGIMKILSKLDDLSGNTSNQESVMEYQGLRREFLDGIWEQREEVAKWIFDNKIDPHELLELNTLKSYAVCLEITETRMQAWQYIPELIWDIAKLNRHIDMSKLIEDGPTKRLCFAVMSCVILCGGLIGTVQDENKILTGIAAIAILQSLFNTFMFFEGMKPIVSEHLSDEEKTAILSSRVQGDIYKLIPEFNSLLAETKNFDIVNLMAFLECHTEILALIDLSRKAVTSEAPESTSTNLEELAAHELTSSDLNQLARRLASIREVNAGTS